MKFCSDTWYEVLLCYILWSSVVLLNTKFSIDMFYKVIRHTYPKKFYSYLTKYPKVAVFSTWHRLAWYTFFSITQQPLLGQGSSLSRPHEHTLRHTTVGRTPLDEWSARRRDLYLTTHNTRNRQTLMPPAGFEPATPANEWPQTHALDQVATGIGLLWNIGS